MEQNSERLKTLRRTGSLLAVALRSGDLAREQAPQSGA